MGAFINPANTIRRRELLAHATALFLSLTIHIAVDLYLVSIGFIDNRASPKTDELPPGPIRYSLIVVPEPISIVFAIMFPLN